MKHVSYFAVLFRFFILFLGGAALVLIWVTLESIYIKRLSFEYLMEFSIPATLVLLLGMMLTLMLIVSLRLWRIDSIRQSSIRQKMQDTAMLNRLLRLPIQLFWGTIAYGGVFIPVYHVVHYIVEGHSIVHVDEYYRLNFLRSFLYEQTITLIAAIFHFAVARRLIRPILLSLDHTEDMQWRFKSFLSMLTATFSGLLLVLQFSILWYIMVTIVKGEVFELNVLTGLVVLDLLFAGVIFILLSYQFRRELIILVRSIRDWLKADRSQASMEDTKRAHPISFLPILSDDEVGKLALSFNRLQAKVQREYEELEQELKLARQVQEQLMPNLAQLSANDRFEVLRQNEADGLSVSNEFYDIIPWKQGYVAVIGSSELIGIPAALHISAAQLLLRAELNVVELQLGELDLRSLLTHYEQRLQDIFLHKDRASQQTLFAKGSHITLSIAVIDASHGTIRCASLGEQAAIWTELAGVKTMLSYGERCWQAGEQLYLSANDARYTSLRITHEHGGSDSL